MRRSILWPPKLAGGRLAMTPDPNDPGADFDVELRQIIGLGLLDGSSGNPFNAGDELGVNDPTFRGATNAERGVIRGQIRRRFRRLERDRRARLVSVEFRTDTVQGNPRLLADITYTNLETGERRDMELAI